MVSRKQINKLRVNNSWFTRFVPNFLSFHSRIKKKKKYGRMNRILRVRVNCVRYELLLSFQATIFLFISISVIIIVYKIEMNRILQN